MEDFFTYGHRYYYPHMKPNDIAIWERFMAAEPEYFEEVQYDVTVGSPPPFDPTVNDSTGGEVSDLYKKKIDVIGWRDDFPFIVEVKPRAGSAAIGQVLGYIEMYKRDHRPINPPKPMILTDTTSPDLEIMAKRYGVEILIA